MGITQPMEDAAKEPHILSFTITKIIVMRTKKAVISFAILCNRPAGRSLTIVTATLILDALIIHVIQPGWMTREEWYHKLIVNEMNVAQRTALLSPREFSERWGTSLVSSLTENRMWNTLLLLTGSAKKIVTDTHTISVAKVAQKSSHHNLRSFARWPRRKIVERMAIP